MAKKNYTKGNPYKVGDIVTSTWGYSMTLVEFYEVVRTTPCKVELRELQQEESHEGFLSGHTTPKPGCYADYSNAPLSPEKGQLCKVREDGAVVIPDYPGSNYHILARKWNGKPKYFNHCD